MARLEFIRLPLARPSVQNGAVVYRPHLVVDPKTRVAIQVVLDRLPQLLWTSGKTWDEANLWLLSRSRLVPIGELKEDTLTANGKDLLAYANWLEIACKRWWECHAKEDERPLNLYRGYLVGSYQQGLIAPTLASRRMATLLPFYRWLLSEEILSPGFALWSERNVRVAYEDAFGFQRHVDAVQTTLGIRTVSRNVDETCLEEGLHPVSPKLRDAMLEFAHRKASRELFLMLSLGFWSGLRLGTICDLRIQTLENAVRIEGCEQLMHLHVGPGANPPVRMKLDQSSDGIVIPTELLEELLDYSCSLVRGKREALAKPEHKDLVFLTSKGNSYGRERGDRSPTVNAEMSRFKENARTEGLRIADFTFHCARATFATTWARAARANGHLYEFMPTLKRMMAHKHDRSTERYIRWVEKEEVRAAVMDEYTKTMFGPFYQAARQANA